MKKENLQIKFIASVGPGLKQTHRRQQEEFILLLL